MKDFIWTMMQLEDLRVIDLLHFYQTSEILQFCTYVYLPQHPQFIH